MELIENPFSELHNQISDIFALVYARVRWKDFTRIGHSAADSMVSTLNIGKNEPDILRCIERVCRRYGILSIRAEIPDLDALYRRNSEVMLIIRDNTLAIALLAQQKAKAKKLELETEKKSKTEQKNVCD
jgi:hypothetical protein